MAKLKPSFDKTEIALLGGTTVCISVIIIQGVLAILDIAQINPLIELVMLVAGVILSGSFRSHRKYRHLIVDKQQPN